MTKESLIQLTNNLYRLTLLFPKKEPLRYKMRELADEILAHQTEKDLEIITNRGLSSVKFTEDFPLSILEDLEVLDSFFEVAKAQNWVKNSELLSLQREYQNLKNQFQAQAQKGEQIERPIVQAGENFSINERQQKILEILKEKGQSQVWEVQKVFPNVSKRTLRRDFRALLKQGLLERRGARNTTFYHLKAADLRKEV